jgi:hypothetical protein
MDARKMVVVLGLLLLVALALSSTMGGMMRPGGPGPGFPGRWRVDVGSRYVAGWRGDADLLGPLIVDQYEQMRKDLEP